jgi:hypothetical protein
MKTTTTINPTFQMLSFINSQELLEAYKNIAETKGFYVDVEDLTDREANLLLLNYEIAQTKEIHFIFSQGIIDFILLVAKRTEPYLDILPKIANNEVKEGEVEHYLLKKILEIRRQKHRAFIGQKIANNEI